MIKKFIILLLGLALVSSVYLLVNRQGAQPVGGERDSHGCLSPAGYSFDVEIGACARGWELTPDIRAAAKQAVDLVGQGYALTVTLFNSYEEPGAYDITLERGEERTQQTVYIRNGKASLTAPASE